MSLPSRRRTHSRCHSPANLSLPGGSTRVVLRRRRCSEPPSRSRSQRGTWARQMLLVALVLMAAGPVWAIGEAIAERYHEEIAVVARQTRQHLDWVSVRRPEAAPSKPFVQPSAPAVSHGGKGAFAKAFASVWGSGASSGVSAKASATAATINPYARSAAGAMVAPAMAAWASAGRAEPSHFAGQVTSRRASEVTAHTPVPSRTPAPAAVGGTFTWSGAEAGGVTPDPAQAYWANPGDWVGGAAPGTNANADIVFAATPATATASIVQTGYTIHSLSFQPGAPAYTVSSVSNGALTINEGGITQSSASAQTLTVPVVLGAVQTWNVGDGAGVLAVNSTISGTGGITKGGGGTLTLSGANTYMGNTDVNGGTLVITGNVGVSNSTASFSISRGVAELDAGGTLLTANTYVGTISDGIFNQMGGTQTVSGDLLLGLTLTGPGTFNLSGGTLTASEITSSGGGRGTFNFNGGTLRAGKSDNPGAASGATTFMQGLTAANIQVGGAIIDTNGFNVTVAQSLTSDPTLNSGTRDGGLTKNGAGTLTVTGTNFYSGATTVNAGTLAVPAGSNGSVNRINVGTGATLAISGSGNVTGRTGLTVDGTAANPASVQLADTGELLTGLTRIGMTGTGSVAQTGGTFDTNGSSLSLGQSSQSNGRYTLSGTGLLTTSGINIGGNGKGDFNQSGGTVNDLGGPLSLGYAAGGSGTYELSGGLLNTANDILSDNASTGTFTQTGGTHFTNGMVLTGNSTASVGTYNLDGGTLKMNGVITAGDGGVKGTSTFNFNGGTLQTLFSDNPNAPGVPAGFLGGLTTANVRDGGAIIDTKIFGVTIAQAMVHSTISGDHTVDGGLTKQGAGTLTLTANNTYTGDTVVKAGTLLVNNVPVNAGDSGTGTGTVFVGPGARLGGTGRIGGNVAVGITGVILPGPTFAPGPKDAATSAALAPGVGGAGTLTINGNLTLASNAVVTITLGNVPDASEALVGGNVTLAGALELTLGTGVTLAVGDKFFVVDLTNDRSQVSGTFENVGAGGTFVDDRGNTYAINYGDNAGDGLVANDVSLTVMSVPEPGTWAWVAVGMAGMVAGRQKAKCKRQKEEGKRQKEAGGR